MCRGLSEVPTDSTPITLILLQTSKMLKVWIKHISSRDLGEGLAQLSYSILNHARPEPDTPCYTKLFEHGSFTAKFNSPNPTKQNSINQKKYIFCTIIEGIFLYLFKGSYRVY